MQSTPPLPIWSKKNSKRLYFPNAYSLQLRRTRTNWWVDNRYLYTNSYYVADMRINKSFDVVYLAYSCLGLSFDFENRSEDQTFEIAPRCRLTIDEFYFYNTNCISLKGMSSLNKGRCHLIFCVSAATRGRRRRRTDSAVDACPTATIKVFTRAKHRQHLMLKVIESNV